MVPLAAWGQTTAVELSTDTSIEAVTGVAEEDQQQGSARRAQLLPYGLLYRSYIAGEKEPRIGRL